jgi:serine/threonine-protein kinase
MAARGDARDRFRLREQLGSGSTATVWRAEDRATGAECALKILHPGFALKPAARVRFSIEARAMESLQHRHVIGFIDAGTDRADPYIAMEIAPGGTLEDRLRLIGGFAPGDASSIVLQVSKGVRAAHAAGIIHRDLRPSSILIGRRDLLKVSDFGTARLPSGGGTLEPTPSHLLAYQSPEQRADPRRAEQASDIYALGALLYTLVTGRTPPDLFAAEKAPEMLAMLPEPLARVVSRATRYLPQQRYPGAFELARSLHTAAQELGADLDAPTTSEEFFRR